MKQYLLSVYQPDGDPPAEIDMGAIMRDVRAWDQELRDAGAWVFTAGLHPASTATVVRAKDGDPLYTDGPYVEGKEHLGGFTVIRAEHLDAALEWAAKLGRATMLPIEVRPVHEG
ncbi:hypothetical protein Aph01nite_41200 [Acrocarpospora phusangensis]|uniref:YCII-related domain-containing protein n=1 Tax=Acrocarpospora phusangensis TaxID=1070424 RepID=A0A919QG27_9ACTN|nr:YciI family protein [Acrocarpospora phusangensis]GIH25810.1 hypothetical protein Aph01nite_41200 [Acrocarpospora phusangensis]